MNFELQLKNLLAVIHKDGGHYTEAKGLSKSLDDAILIVVKLHHSEEQERVQNCITKDKITFIESKDNPRPVYPEDIDKAFAKSDPWHYNISDTEAHSDHNSSLNLEKSQKKFKFVKKNLE